MAELYAADYFNIFYFHWKIYQGRIFIYDKTDYLPASINFILPTLWGIDGILVAGPIADCMAGVTAVIMVIYEFKKMGKNG